MEEGLANRTSDPVIRIVRYKQKSPNLFGTVCKYSRKKCRLLKDCVVYSPIYAMNVVFIASLMPFEFSVVKTFGRHLYQHVADVKICDKSYDRSVYFLVLALAVLICSLILIQICVLIYFCDLINTSIDKHSKKPQIIAKPDPKPSPMSTKHVEARLRIQDLRQKNILFHQFLKQSRPMATTTPDTPDRVRTISSATTVAAQDSPSSYVEPSVSYVVEPYTYVAYLWFNNSCIHKIIICLPISQIISQFI